MPSCNRSVPTISLKKPVTLELAFFLKKHVTLGAVDVRCNYHLGSVWLEEWKSGRMEKWENRKDLVFPHVCFVGGVKKWEGEKLFYLVGEKKGRMETVVYIN